MPIHAGSTRSGYGLAIAVGVACARLLPLPRVEAAMIGTLLSVPITAIGAVCAFALRSIRTVAFGILGSAIVLGTAGWLAGVSA